MLKHIRLINGEELLGIVLEETKDDWNIQQPLLVEELDSADGSSRKVLTNYIRFSSAEIPTCRISKSHIITVIDVHPEVQKYYENSLIFAKDYDDEFIFSIKSANDKMNDYIQDTHQIPYIEEDEFNLINNPFYHEVSNTSH